MLCDFFNIDRSSDESKKGLDKETLIDRLLDFLGAPDEELTKGFKHKESKNKKSPKQKGTAIKSGGKKKVSKKDEGEDEDEHGEDEEDDEEEEEEPEEPQDYSKIKAFKHGETPDDDALRQWVRAYVACFNMDAATTKHAIKTASDKFGVDLTERKERIKELLAEEM